MSEQSGPLPVVSFLKLPAGGQASSPYLEALKCGECGAFFLDRRSTCSKCGTRDKLEPTPLKATGTLHAFTVVYRSFPGVPVPYISAVVDMDGGGTVKGNLRDVDPDPAKVQAGLRVKLGFDIASAKDKDGNEYMAYYFEPAGGAA